MSSVTSKPTLYVVDDFIDRVMHNPVLNAPRTSRIALERRQAEARFTAVFYLSDPYLPLQLPSIAVGAGEDTRDHALTGDGKFLVVPNRLDNSVSVIDVAARVVRTFSTVAKPNRVATFGEGIGPS